MDRLIAQVLIVLVALALPARAEQLCYEPARYEVDISSVDYWGPASTSTLKGPLLQAYYAKNFESATWQHRYIRSMWEANFLSEKIQGQEEYIRGLENAIERYIVKRGTFPVINGVAFVPVHVASGTVKP